MGSGATRFRTELVPMWGSGMCKVRTLATRPPSRAKVVIFFFKDLFYFYWKGGYTERRDREEDLLFDDSLPK